MDIPVDLPKIPAPIAAADAARVNAAGSRGRGNAIACACAFVTAALGVFVLAGWFSSTAWLATLGTEFAMAPNTALGFVLAAAALCAHLARQDSTTLRSLSAFCAVGVALIGGLTAAQYWFGADLRIDALLAIDTEGIVRTRFPQRMTENTSILLALLGFSLLALQVRSRAGADPLVTINSQGKITDVNKATEEATGLAREDLIGTDFARYFTDPESAHAGYLRVLAEGLVRDYPLTIRHRSGRTMDVLYNATTYMSESGELQGVFAAARDVTDRKRAAVDRELRMIELKEQVNELCARLGQPQRYRVELKQGTAEAALEKA